MSTFRVKKYDEILNDMITWMIATQESITDFNEGSVIRSMLEAVARIAEEQYIRFKAANNRYMPILPFTVFDFQKKMGSKAGGHVVFSRQSPAVQAVTIPAGTIVSTPAGLRFVTQVNGTIAASTSNSNFVAILAEREGSAYNVPASTITVMISPVTGVDSVSNSQTVSGGFDEETETDYLRRFREFIMGLGKSSRWGLVTAAKSVTGVQSASVVEHFPPLDGVYNATVFIEDATGGASSSLINEVMGIINGDGTVDNPGYRAAGIQVRVIAPTVVNVAIDVSINISGSLSVAFVESEVKRTIERYVNMRGIGQPVVLASMIREAMGINSVLDVVFSAPSENVSIGPDQTARVSTFEISTTISE